MTTPPLDLTAERITALRDIANAATEGPWRVIEGDGWDGPGVAMDESGMQIGIAYICEKFGQGESEGEDDAAFVAAFDPPTALALLDELDKAKRACQTLGRIIDRQCEDALTATDSQDLLWGDDGDGDWGAIWERVLGLGEKAREATARAEAAEKQVAAVRALLDRWERLQRMLAVAPGASMTPLEDVISDLRGTIAALDTHTPETETP